VSEAVARGGATQQRVRDAVVQVGGYWRPLAGVARLLEELGELSEIFDASAPTADEFAAELADLWIITTVVADQFLGHVAEPGSRLHQASPAGRSFKDLVVDAGQIARIVNYYDGPKTPRSTEGWPSLDQTVARFHDILSAIADAHDVDLAQAVDAKLDVIVARDSGRFAGPERDPSTAACLERFRMSEAAAPFTEPVQPRLWGAPDWSVESVGANIEAIVPQLVSFTRAATREQLDAYVIAGPRCRSAQSASQWLASLLSGLAARDPTRDGRVHDLAGSANWQFRFNGLSMVVTVSPSPCDGDRTHRSPADAFAVLRPHERA
jgi:hypothetical protein